jgi:hypothetical protein
VRLSAVVLVLQICAHAEVQQGVRHSSAMLNLATDGQRLPRDRLGAVCGTASPVEKRQRIQCATSYRDWNIESI